jgi:Protein of unknown function (DUF4064)
MRRTTEFVLGLLGGLIGVGSAFFALIFGSVDEAVNGSSEVTSLGGIALVVSLIAIVASVLVKFKAKLGGWLMVATGVVGLVCISLFYVLPFVLLMIAGLMGIFRQPKS